TLNTTPTASTLPSHPSASGERKRHGRFVRSPRRAPPQPITRAMRSVEDVEAYLGKMNRRYSPVDDHPSTFLVHGGTNMPPTALRVDPPLVVLRVHVGDVEGDPASNAELFQKLLSLNARS